MAKKKTQAPWKRLRPPERTPSNRKRKFGEDWYDDEIFPPPDPPPAAVAVADRLHSAAIHLLRRLRREDDASGLSAARLSALSVVVFSPALRLGDLAAAERVAVPTMSRLVAGLVGDGLVTRVADPEDGRVLLVEATEAGRRLLDEGRKRRVAALARDVAELPADLASGLEAVLDTLEYLAMPDEHPTQLG